MSQRCVKGQKVMLVRGEVSLGGDCRAADGGFLLEAALNLELQILRRDSQTTSLGPELSHGLQSEMGDGRAQTQGKARKSV